MTVEAFVVDNSPPRPLRPHGPTRRHTVAWTSAATSWRGCQGEVPRRSSPRRDTTPRGRVRTSNSWNPCRAYLVSARTTGRAQERATPPGRDARHEFLRGEGTTRPAGRSRDITPIRPRGPFLRRFHRSAVRCHISPTDSPSRPARLLSRGRDQAVPPLLRNSPEGDWVDGGDRIDIDATRRALRETARDYGAVPLAIVKAGRYEDVLTVALWDRTQADLATLSPTRCSSKRGEGISSVTQIGAPRDPEQAPRKDVSSATTPLLTREGAIHQ